MLGVFICLNLMVLFVDAQSVFYSQGFSDSNCQTSTGAQRSLYVPPTGVACTFLQVGGTSYTIAVRISGSDFILNRCSGCSGGVCGSASADVTIANGACKPGSDIGAASGSFRFTTQTTTIVTLRRYNDAPGVCTTEVTPEFPTGVAEGGSCETIFTPISTSFAAVVNGNQMTVTICSGSPFCSSGSACTTVSATHTVQNGTCYVASSIGLSSIYNLKFTWDLPPPPPQTTSSNPCFHEDTEITYKGEKFNLAQLQVHNDCAIPHIVTAIGHVIHAQCGSESKTLRLTSGHLVYTQRGLQAAQDITTSDTVYSDLEEQHSCKVLKIEKENKEHKYFGLNCHSSEVLASGIKASTFEKLHSVPSFWMSIMGRILGIKRASKIGLYIEELVSRMNLV